MTNYVTFNKYIFAGCDAIKWCNRFGVMVFKDKVVELQLNTAGVQGDYSGYHVTIKNKNSGDIASHFFNFNDAMFGSDRIDSRKDYKGDFHISDHCCNHQTRFASGSDYWYIATPNAAAIERYRNVVNAYIEAYI